MSLEPNQSYDMPFTGDVGQICNLLKRWLPQMANAIRNLESRAAASGPASWAASGIGAQQPVPEGGDARDAYKAQGAGVDASNYPNWLLPNRNSQKTYTEYCRVLGFAPNELQIADKLSKLDKVHLWTKTTMAARLECNPTEAAGWAYFGKCLGIMEYDQTKRCYRKIK